MKRFFSLLITTVLLLSVLSASAEPAVTKAPLQTHTIEKKTTPLIIDDNPNPAGEVTLYFLDGVEEVLHSPPLRQSGISILRLVEPDQRHNFIPKSVSLRSA